MAADEQTTAEPATTSRRRLIQAGAGAAALAWVAPSITTSAGAAVGSQPPPQPGFAQGFVTSCGHEADPGDTWSVQADDPVGGGSGSTTTGETGYFLTLPPGTYDITLHPNGPGNTGQPDQVFAGAVVITTGAFTFTNFDYTENGC